jgi:hypothetical protein
LATKRSIVIPLPLAGGVRGGLATQSDNIRIKRQVFRREAAYAPAPNPSRKREGSIIALAENLIPSDRRML